MLNKLLVLFLALCFCVSGFAAATPADGDVILSSGSVGLSRLGSTVTNEFTNSAEVNSLADTRIGLAKLENLDSVEITSPANGQVLVWDGVNHYWKNAATSVADGSITSAKFTANLFGQGLYINGPSVEVKLDGGTLTKSADGLKITNGGVDTTQIAADAVDDSKIDFGTDAGQVSGGDVPIVDAGGYYSTHECESALQEIGAAFAGAITADKIERAIESFTTTSENYVCNLAQTPLYVPQLFYGGAVIQVPGTGYNYSKVGKTCTLIGGEAGVTIVVSYEYIIP